MLNSKTWQRLSEYESRDIIAQRFRQKHGRAINAGLANEITSSFTQARHYFESAYEADRSVKPLILYYGVLSLSRGLILFLSGRREATLSQSHGLSTRNWTQTLSNAQNDIGNLEVVVTDGTLSELCEATNNTSVLRLNSSAATHLNEHRRTNFNGAVLNLSNLVSRIPEIAHSNPHWITEPNCASGSVQATTPPNYTITVNRQTERVVLDESIVERIFGPNLTINSTPENSSFSALGVNAIIWDRTSSFLGIGDMFFVAHFPNGHIISKLCSEFILSYILGMLVRYHPSKWMALIRNSGGDVSMPTLMQSMNFIEESFPQSVLDQLEKDILTLQALNT